MHRFGITQVLGMDVSMDKFDDDAIRHLVLSNEAAAAAITGDIGIVFICRDDLKNYKNDSWVNKGTTYHTIIVPHEAVVANAKEAVSILCADLLVHRLLWWAEKRRQKALKTRPKKAA